jgi:hypothetical protein
MAAVTRNRWIALAVALAAVALLFSGLTINLDWGPAHLGDVSSWIASVSTGGALIAGVLVLNLQRRDLREREADRLAEVEEKRAEQARHVSAWWRGYEGAGSAGPSASLLDAITYQNTGTEPVYYATVFALSGWGGNPDIYPETIGIIPPSTRSDGPIGAPIAGESPSSGMTPPPIVITFRDAAGQWWRRDQHGALTRHQEEPEVVPERPPPDLD